MRHRHLRGGREEVEGEGGEEEAEEAYKEVEWGGEEEGAAGMAEEDTEWGSEGGVRRQCGSQGAASRVIRREDWEGVMLRLAVVVLVPVLVLVQVLVVPVLVVEVQQVQQQRAVEARKHQEETLHLVLALQQLEGNITTSSNSSSRQQVVGVCKQVLLLLLVRLDPRVPR